LQRCVEIAPQFLPMLNFRLKMLAKKCCWFYGQQKSGAFEAFFVLGEK
jgi:hypothetical protein